jgi:voltage-gated potassium channel
LRRSQDIERMSPKALLRSGGVLRMRQLWLRLYRTARMENWFPHVPLALAVGLAGLVQTVPSVGRLQQLIAFPSQELGGLSDGYSLLAIRGVPQDVIGVLLLIMSLGLLWRSRLAWVITLLMTLATLALELTPLSHPRPSVLAYNCVLVVLLLATRRCFQRASLATGTLFAVTGILLTLGYGVLGAYVLGAGFSPRINDFTSALYFAVVTMSTVGYGDITPHTSEARLFTVSLIVLGLVVFATSLSVTLGPIVNQRLMNLLQPQRKSMKRKDHIIVVGDNPLARNAIKALSSRGLPVTAVWSSRPPEGAEAPSDLVVGDGGDTDVLSSAGVGSARAVLALSEDDSDNAFVVLAAKEVNEKVRTVVAVSDAHNLVRVRRVHPDVVLALPVIGGELLAMALSGEEIKADALVEQLLKLS